MLEKLIQELIDVTKANTAAVKENTEVLVRLKAGVPLPVTGAANETKTNATPPAPANAETPAAKPAETSASTAPSAPAGAAPSNEAAPAATKESATKAVLDLCKYTKSNDYGLAALRKVGGETAKNLADIKPDQYQAVIDACAEQKAAFDAKAAQQKQAA